MALTVARFILTILAAELLHYVFPEMGAVRIALAVVAIAIIAVVAHDSPGPRVYTPDAASDRRQREGDYYT